VLVRVLGVILRLGAVLVGSDRVLLRIGVLALVVMMSGLTVMMGGGLVLCSRVVVLLACGVLLYFAHGVSFGIGEVPAEGMYAEVRSPQAASSDDFVAKLLVAGELQYQ